ncbi:cytochrome c [Paenibacillus sp. OV219]|uniref:c-type cytochrome n=1 Tax=Paenibacillus sp. OV219 TaxID=1884377 RepID=UPI0008D28FA8|nr:cytochrome c [Paenibacillus sp. OV219]SEP11370.1 cytochrome c551 [Paenibacillus sp. OV219]
MSNHSTYKIFSAKWGFFVLSALFAATLLSGCDSSSSVQTAAADVPKVFKSNCISCHGTDLQGRMGASTNLTQVGKRMTQDEITKQIKDGGGGMPAFGGRLSAAEIEDLASWLSKKK